MNIRFQTGTQRGSMSNSRWINLLTVYLVIVGSSLPYAGWSPSLAVISIDLGLSYAQAGSISSATGLVAGLMVLAGGALAARWGSKQIIVAGLVAGAAGQLVFAMADGFGSVIAGRILAGLSVGFMWVGSFTMAAEWFRAGNQTGRAFGILASGDGVGALLSLFAFSAVLVAIGWRLGLAVQAVWLLAVLLVVLLFSKNAPSLDADLASSHDPHQETGRPSSKRSVMNRNVLSALIFWFGSIGLFSTIASWMPTILVENAGFSESRAGLLTSLFSIAGMVAALGGPLIANRLGSKKRVVITGGIVSGVAVALVTAFIATDNYLGVALLIPVIGLGMYSGEPLILAEAIESVSGRYAGIVNGVILGFPWVVSGVAYPYVIGLIRDATGSFVGGFLAVAVATFLLCGVSPLFVRDSSPSVKVAATA